jgi:hypothetical protein
MRLTNYPDVESIRQTKEIELYTTDKVNVVLTIQDLSPSYADDMARELPEPAPPVVGALKNPDGRGFVKDDKGRNQMEYDFLNEDYLAKCAVHRIHGLVFMVLQGVSPDQMEFATTRDDGVSPQQYYSALMGEMKAFGFGIGQITKIANAIRDLSGITDEDIEQAQAGFTAEST